MRYLIVGLGNLGEVYVHTRHNIGFRIVDHLASKHKALFKLERLGAIAPIQHASCQLFLLKPSTYMNNSGRAVRYWLKHFAIPLERLLVVTDDLHLPFGHLRIKPQGGHGGHNGLKSIAEAIQSTHYARLKFGIGDGFSPGRQADFVLDNFTLDETKELPLYIEQAGQMGYDFCRLGIQKVMGLYNKKPQL